MTDFIKNYWEKQAQTFKSSHEASWGDNFMIDLEIETIGKHFSDGQNVLDVGCANGYSTFRQAATHNISSITGVDYAENMINEALQQQSKLHSGKDIKFAIGDIRDLRFDDNSFDLVYTTRVIINLPNWDEQIKAINECIRVAKPGGKIVFSEAFWEPLVLLNSIRTLKQLPPLIEHDFNRYLKRSKLDEYLQQRQITFEVDDFSSVYYLGTRFIRDLVTDISSYPGFTNPVNKIFYEIEKQFSGGGFGIQLAYILTKNV
jgi:ubiquinone/menaquinone biosynthesis C-methylase UbiE